jgi:hypothetical protein
MGLNHSLVGVPGEPHLRSWDSKDALLYAVGVGAGLGDPLQELEYTTENCQGIEQQVLPTFGVLVAQTRSRRNLGDFDRARLVHAEQYVELHRPLPVAGTVRTTSTVTGMYDKGSGALVVTEDVAVDSETGEPLVTARGGTFIRGEGGFGGPRGAEPPWHNCQTARPTTKWYSRPDPSMLCSTDSPETATPCTSTPSSRLRAASPNRSCTVFAPTGSPGGRCWECSATAIPPASVPCPGGSPGRSCPANRSRSRSGWTTRRLPASTRPETTAPW